MDHFVHTKLIESNIHRTKRLSFLFNSVHIFIHNKSIYKLNKHYSSDLSRPLRNRIGASTSFAAQLTYNDL